MNTSNETTDFPDYDATDLDLVAARTDRSDGFYSFELEQGTPPSEAVVAAIASVMDGSPLELDPLYSWVDPDALDDLLASAELVSSRSDATVRFTYAGFEVIVCNGGTLLVGPPRG